MALAWTVTLIANGGNLRLTAPWLSLGPGLFAMTTVLSENHLARPLEEASR